MKPKHIVYIVPYFYPLRGGTENNCLNMALQSVARGYQVTVLTSDRRFGVKLERKSENYKGIEIKRLRRLFFRQYYLTFLPALPWVLLRTPCDVVHTHIPGIFWTDLAVFLKKLLSRRLITINTPHDPFMSRDSYRGLTRIVRRVYSSWLSIYYPFLYDFVIAVNPHQDQWIKRLYNVLPQRIVYVPNGINSELLTETEILPSLRKELGITDQLVIAMVARYHEYKGYQTVLQALDFIKHKRPLRVKFIGIGDDSGMLVRLQNFIRDHDLGDMVTLLQSPNDSVRDQVLQMSEIFILASRVEAFGISIVEAMAKGNAIITTRTEGGKYLVGEQNGLLYDFGDSENLVEHIVKLTTDEALRQQMIEANYQVAKRFIWDQTYAPYQEVLESSKLPVRPSLGVTK